MGRGRPKKSASLQSDASNGGKSTTQKQKEVSTESEKRQEEATEGNDSIELIESFEEGNPKNNGKQIEDPIMKNTQEAEQLWVDIIKGNRNTANGVAIQYVAPTIIDGKVEVVLEEEDILSEIRYWETSVIMYVIGADLSMHAVKNYMQNVEFCHAA